MDSVARRCSENRRKEFLRNKKALKIMSEARGFYGV